MIVEWVLCSAAGGLFARCVFWHVPQMLRMMLRMMLATRCNECGAWWNDNEMYCDRHTFAYCGDSRCAPLAPALPDPEADDRRWARMLHDNPLAFWLDPNLWNDNPQVPVRPARISSSRRFDVKCGTVPDYRRNR